MNKNWLPILGLVLALGAAIMLYTLKFSVDYAVERELFNVNVHVDTGGNEYTERQGNLYVAISDSNTAAPTFSTVVAQGTDDITVPTYPDAAARYLWFAVLASNNPTCDVRPKGGPLNSESSFEQFHTNATIDSKIYRLIVSKVKFYNTISATEFTVRVC